MNLQQQYNDCQLKLHQLEQLLIESRKPIEPAILRQMFDDLDRANRYLSSRLLKLEKFARNCDLNQAEMLGIVEEVPF